MTKWFMFEAKVIFDSIVVRNIASQGPLRAMVERLINKILPIISIVFHTFVEMPLCFLKRLVETIFRVHTFLT